MRTVARFNDLQPHQPGLQKNHGNCNNSDSGSAINIIKSDLNEIWDNQPTANVNQGNIHKIFLEKIPKIETDEPTNKCDNDDDCIDPDCDPFTDVVCDSNFVSSGEPQSWIETTNTIVQNSSKFKFECKLCLKKLSSQNNLNSHVRICSTSHKDRRLYCVECNRKYSSTDNFKAHNLNIHGRGIEAIKPDYYRIQFQCQFCPMKFVIKNRFKIHTELHVKNLDTAEIKANLLLQLNPYKCQECSSSSTFSTVEDLRNHMLKTHVAQEFKCPELKCGKIFKTKGQLNWHFSSHSDDKPFKCPEPNCGKRFKYKQSMNRHILTINYSSVQSQTVARHLGRSVIWINMGKSITNTMVGVNVMVT